MSSDVVCAEVLEGGVVADCTQRLGTYPMVSTDLHFVSDSQINIMVLSYSIVLCIKWSLVSAFYGPI